jgi:WD40 repeat protein
MRLRITARSVSAVQLLVACLGAGSAAAQWPKEPMLRIDPGTHTAMIRGIDADRAGSWIVTGSFDKTVRVWKAQTGLLEQVLRPPIGEGQEGQVSNVAISPDGRFVACAQRTTTFDSSGNAIDPSGNIYLFSRATAQVLATVHRLPVVADMKFSPDGRTLGVILSGKNGVRLFGIAESGGNGEVPKSSSNGLVLLAQDIGYPGMSLLLSLESLDFSPDGRKLVTGSSDGRVRLYDLSAIRSASSRGFSPSQTYATGGGITSVGPAVKFSPDGTKIALTTSDSARILSANDLHELFKLNTSHPGTAFVLINSINWSSDGNSLLGVVNVPVATKGPIGTRSSIWRWGDGGQGTHVEVWNGEENGDVTGMVLLPSGRVAIADDEGMVAALRSDGSRVWAVKSTVTKFLIPTLLSRSGLADLHLSRDGSSVKFAYGPDGSVSTVFSLRERTLGSTAAVAWTMPSVDAAELDRQPSDNTQELVCFIASTAKEMAPDKQSLLLGDASLRRCSVERKLVWETKTSVAMDAISISEDGRLAVAAFEDGTIRWYNYADGRELLALFLHADRKRWVLWTPSGYYDASPGGEELIGWHLNNGPDKEADFFPASRFRGVKYRPDVISKVLDTLDEGHALSLADAARDKAPAKTSVADALPPVVSIVSPEDGSSISAATVTVRYIVRAPSGEAVTGIRVMIDGRPVPSGPEPGSVKKGDEQSVTVAVPARDSEVSVVALNRFSASVPATIHLMWIQTATPEQFDAKPKLYLLAVGESVYDKPEFRLNYAAKDARDFAAAMQAQKGGLYRDVEVKLLTDAPKDDIEDGLEWLRRQVTSRDVGVIFLAGHGVDDSNGMYYFLPANADLDRLMRTGLVFSDLKNTVQSIAGKAVMFVDTCHSGNVMGTRRGVTDINQVVNELASVENGAVVFTASTGRQFSLEDAQWQNGAFTKALVEGIGGKADYTGKGKVTINMLELYLSERVKELTNGRQTPATSKPNTVPDFPLAMKQ